jgi:hypothetical protein
MHRHLTIAFAGAALSLCIASAHAGPCTSAIAQFERGLHQSANDPGAGPTARQSIGAQLSHQPTPSSVKRADERAQTKFARGKGTQVGETVLILSAWVPFPSRRDTALGRG